MSLFLHHVVVVVVVVVVVAVVVVVVVAAAAAAGNNPTFVSQNVPVALRRLILNHSKTDPFIYQT